MSGRPARSCIFSSNLGVMSTSRTSTVTDAILTGRHPVTTEIKRLLQFINCPPGQTVKNHTDDGCKRPHYGPPASYHYYFNSDRHFIITGIYGSNIP